MSDNLRGVVKSGAVVDPQTNSMPIPIAVKGQRYVAPPGRHSRQTHRRAEERAAAQGHATEKEQHAYDRSLVKTEMNKRAERLAKKQQGVKSAPKPLPQGNAADNAGKELPADPRPAV